MEASEALASTKRGHAQDPKERQKKTPHAAWKTSKERRQSFLLQQKEKTSSAPSSASSSSSTSREKRTFGSSLPARSVSAAPEGRKKRKNRGTAKRRKRERKKDLTPERHGGVFPHLRERPFVRPSQRRRRRR